MGIRNPNSTNYVHADEPNLLNLHKSMQYNASGEPQLRVHVDGISLEGDVIVDRVKLWDGTNELTFDSSVNDGEASPTVVLPTENHNMVFNGSTWDRMRGNIADGVLVKLSNGSIAVTGTFWQATQPVSIATMPTTPVTGTFWQATQPVSGTVTVQDGGGSITVDGTLAISSMPPVQLSNDDSTPLQVIGNVEISNDVGNPIPISGTVDLGATTLSALENTTVTVTGSVVVDNDSSNPLEVNAQITNVDPISVNVTGPVTVTQAGGTANLVKYINTPDNLQMDMTQRLRVSNPSQSWWYAPTVDKDGDLRYIESNVGANSGSVFVQNLASINMTSGTAANGSFIRISRRRHKMRPGVSMSASFALNWNGYVPDGKVVKRAGVFTNYNGIFYEMTGDLQVVIRRRLTDGTLVEQRIARADFTIDKLDGTGETGYDLRPVISETSALTAFVSKTAVPITGDGTVYRVVFTVADPTAFAVSKKGRITGVTPELYNGTVLVTAINGSNVTVVYTHDPGTFGSIGTGNFVHTAFHHHYTFGFDFNGNRTTSVRFFIDGPLGRVAIHQENFGGELGSPFFNAPAVSTRYEIFNTAAPGRLPAFSCSSEVINIEAEAELNPGFGVASNNTPVTYAKGGTATHPVLGIALRAGEPYQRSDLQVQGVTFADVANINQQNAGVFYWRLVLNPTIGGTVPASIDVGKSTRYWKYTAATTVSGGIDLLSGYASSTQQFDVRSALNFVNLGSNIEYTDSDKIVLVVQQLVGGTADAQLVATINFIEAL